MKFIDLFPKTIGIVQLQTLTPDLILRGIEHIERSSKVELGVNGSYTSDQQLLEQELFREIKQEICTLCKTYAEGYSHIVQEIGICNSWGNVVDHGQCIPAHKHNNSYISGSFYLTDGSTLAITNSDFNELFGFMPQVKSGNYRSREVYCIDPEPGMLIMFPSALYHSVSKSRSYNKRYSIAFNTIPLGPTGMPTGLFDLSINRSAH
ncbi:MAG: TIGR02466 family protein [Pseudomonadales bacterium]|nr:TIGR02466 family protein [Pseudomonadales bacterium]